MSLRYSNGLHSGYITVFINPVNEWHATIHRREGGHHRDVGQSGIMRLFHDIEPNIQLNSFKFGNCIVDIYYFVEKSEEGPRCITARLIQGQMQRGTEEVGPKKGEYTEAM